MKKIMNLFCCDQCGKQSNVIPEKEDYPYMEGWIYLHSLKFKEMSHQNKETLDKHFCSKECLREFIKEKLGGIK